MNDAALPQLPPRANQSHKGDYGRVLLVGGSRGMSGAVALAGMAALKSGAGLVTLAVPDSCLETVASFCPCYMTIPLPEDEGGRISQQAEQRLLDLSGNFDCLAYGPGLGQSNDLQALTQSLYRQIEKPLVVDADGLNALAASLPASGGGPRILTPHPGEFQRLRGEERPARSELEESCITLAGQLGAVMVLKGNRSLVTDGTLAQHNTTGNPGMATAGSGDVLTGVIVGLLGQSLSPLDAARLGTHVHGAAGDFAAEKLGMAGMTATDIIDCLPMALQATTEPKR